MKWACKAEYHVWKAAKRWKSVGSYSFIDLIAGFSYKLCIYMFCKVVFWIKRLSPLPCNSLAVSSECKGETRVSRDSKIQCFEGTQIYILNILSFGTERVTRGCREELIDCLVYGS